MHEIEIFDAEVSDGIAELVKTQASVAFYSPATKVDREIAIEDKIFAALSESATAENKNQFDLYYLESVLASVGWNKNDDVFLPDRAWLARNTPEDKQFNFMHDEDDIIGHITGCYIIDKNGNVVDLNSETHPEEFDIITRAVIYNSWSGEEKRERFGKIFEEIEEGKWYVSMECLFAGFDYAVQDKTGATKIVTRDQASAFLTKHLRAYGGTGVYEGYRIGRALRQITFSGKGLVNKPANPRSIIYPKTVASVTFNEHELTFPIGESTMPEPNALESQVASLKAELEAAKAENATIKAQAEKAKTDEFASKIAALEGTVKEKELSSAQFVTDLKAAQSKISELEAAVTKANEEAKAAKDECDKMKKEQTFTKRKARLVESGFSPEDAEASLSAYEALDEVSFETVCAQWSKVKKPAEASATTEPPKAPEVTPAIVDGLKTTEAELVVPAQSESEAAEKTRAALAAWFEKDVLKRKPKTVAAKS